MVLDAKQILFGISEAFKRIVVQVTMRNDYIFGKVDSSII